MEHDNIISEIQAMIKYVLLELQVQVRLQNTISYIQTIIINVLRQLQSKFGLNDKIIVYRAGVTISQFEQVSQDIVLSSDFHILKQTFYAQTKSFNLY